MLKTNPEINQILIPANNANTVDPRNDLKPYSDINVRIAMQKAIDLPTLAKTYYAGNAPPNPSPLPHNTLSAGAFLTVNGLRTSKTNILTTPRPPRNCWLTPAILTASPLTLSLIPPEMRIC